VFFIDIDLSHMDLTGQSYQSTGSSESHTMLSRTYRRREIGVRRREREREIGREERRGGREMGGDRRR